MRDIKFRGWHKGDRDYKTGKLYPPTMMYDEKQGDILIWARNQPIEITQFTGLKDKNGKEIYEGDILLVDDEYDKTKHSVVWGGNSYPAWTLDPELDTESNCFSEIVNGGNFTMEVIGNIYENPELLNPKESNR